MLLPTICLAFLSVVSGHYTLPSFISNGTSSSEWQYVRMTTNHYSNGPVTDVTNSQIRCYEIDSNQASITAIATVSAGSTVGFKANQVMYHPGYFSVYMSPASPSANSTSAGTGNTWFKVWELSPTYTAGSGFSFQTSLSQITFTIPKSVPSGQYLIRGEHVALHAASTFGGAQYYVSCAQVNVINGGSGTPSPTVSFPGAYTGTEPGLMLNIYSVPAGYAGYSPPGPKVWSG